MEKDFVKLTPSCCFNNRRADNRQIYDCRDFVSRVTLSIWGFVCSCMHVYGAKISSGASAALQSET